MKFNDKGGENLDTSSFIKAVKELISSVKVNETYDIPYTAGYSEDGKTIYFDKDLPKVMKMEGQDIKQFVILHEIVEKQLLNAKDIKYDQAHQLALRIEKAAVEESGISWAKYQGLWEKYIKDIEHQSIDKLPPDLDLEPYKDDHDVRLLKLMKGKK